MIIGIDPHKATHMAVAIDGNDARSTAIAGLRHCGLRTVRGDDHSTVLRLLVGRYDDLVSLRT